MSHHVPTRLYCLGLSFINATLTGSISLLIWANSVSFRGYPFVTYLGSLFVFVFALLTVYWGLRALGVTQETGKTAPGIRRRAQPVKTGR